MNHTGYTAIRVLLYLLTVGCSVGKYTEALIEILSYYEVMPFDDFHLDMDL